MKKIRTAIIGQGRSGRDIHGKFFRGENNTLYDIVAVVEFDAARREQALREYPGCQVYENYTQLFERDDIDLVVNASYSQMHYPITRDLLIHGFNVLVEKPFARTRFECDELIALAKKKGVVLAVFQQSFLAPFYVFAKELIASGKIGDVIQIEIKYNGFGRRWDWQTLQSKVAGGIYNTGPHPIGLALGFLDFDENARVEFSKLACVNVAGDSDDYAKFIITAPGKPVIDVEVNSVDCFKPTTVKICGSNGTYITDISSYSMKYIVPEENTPRPLIVESLKNEEGNPSYCVDDLKFYEESEKFAGTSFDYACMRFYEMLYANLTEGTPLEITPYMAARVISVIEEAHARNPLPLKYVFE